MTWANQKMNAESCTEEKLLRFVAQLHFEAVRLVTSAGGLLRLSLVHKLGRLELLSNSTNDMHQRPEAIFHPGDRGHSNLHEGAGHFLL